MLDGHTYRASQALARRQISNWHIAQFHEVQFERGSFPHDINSLSELGQILDSMQEGRFDQYMTELGGLNHEQCVLLVEALTDLVVIQRSFMPDIPARVAYSAVSSALVVYEKIKSLHPKFRSVLEIGPGCGYLSLFLKSHAGLVNYSQIEASEAYYLLQNAVNTFCFPGRFEERAYPPGASVAQSVFTLDQSLIEPVDSIDIPADPCCTHYPWWKLGDLVDGGRRFDVVTSNANLKEFSRQALLDYLAATYLVMKADGIFLTQCHGAEVHTRDDELQAILFEAGFAPLVYLPVTGSRTQIDPITGSTMEKVFPLSQGVFIREGHPLFGKYYSRDNYNSGFLADEQAIFSMMKPNASGRPYSRKDILELVLESLARRYGARRT